MFHSSSERRDPLGGWLMEISSLLVIFPWLDQVVGEQGTVHWRFPVACWLLAIPCCIAGVLLHRKSERKTRIPTRKLLLVAIPLLVVLAGAFVATCMVGEQVEQRLSGEVSRVVFSTCGTVGTILVCFVVSSVLDKMEEEVPAA